MGFPKKTLWTLGLLGGAWYLASSYASGVWNTIWTVAWAVDQIFELWSGVINSISEPIIWSAAPFAFPMIAWWYMGKKLSDAMAIEWKWKKRAVSITWVWIWAWLWVAASASALSPYLTVAWAWYVVYKWYQWWKYLLKKWYSWIKWFFNWVKAS